MNLHTILSNLNIPKLNAMQKDMLETAKNSKDIVLISPTGSGKTLGFLLPLLSLLTKNITGIQVLIIVPSRELAIQIEQVFKRMQTAYKITCCYGGHSVKIEENRLKESPAVLIGTPGRIVQHIKNKTLALHTVHTLILDEFDKSLEFGFHLEMEFIVNQCQQLKKRILTSATTLKELPAFIQITEKTELNYTTASNKEEPTLQIKSVKVKGDDKLEALMLLLSKINSRSTIIFCNHREAVQRISLQFADYGIHHETYHGAMEQMEREKSIIKFRNGSTRILVSTDLASRGLDIPNIEFIIHYQLPLTEDSFVHRNGRTARMQAHGIVYLLLDINDRIPSFVMPLPKEDILPNAMALPAPSEWQTLYISAGKKDKINTIDIVGMLLQKGNLKKEDIGKIDVLDHSSYVAIKKNCIEKTLQFIKDEKIKNKRVKKAIAF